MNKYFKLVAAGIMDGIDDPNFIDPFGISILQFACKHKRKDIIEKLLEMGANINYQDPDGNTALINICRDNDLDIAILLLKYNPNVNIVNKLKWHYYEDYRPTHGYGHESAIFYTVRNNNVELTKLLLKAGASTEIINYANYHTYLGYLTQNFIQSGYSPAYYADTEMKSLLKF